MVGFLSLRMRLRKSNPPIGGGELCSLVGHWCRATNPTSGGRTDGGFALPSGKGERHPPNPACPVGGYHRTGVNPV